MGSDRFSKVPRWTLVAFLAVTVVVFAQSAQAVSIVFHNGTVSSNPPGSGETEVYLDAPTGLTFALKAFLATDTHVLLADYEGPSPIASASEVVANLTPDAWVVYQLQLLGADFFGPGSGLLAPEINPVDVGGVPGDATIDLYVLGGALGVASSQITRDGENAALRILFDDYVDPGDVFMLVFDVGDVGSPGLPGIGENFFAMAQSAIPVPEPLTAIGFVMASGAIGCSIIRRLRGLGKAPV